jgi:hypothetical protein
MRKASESFLYVAKKFNRIKINCADNWKMRTIDEIWDELYEKVNSYLNN